ncbi:Polysaccharide biosynthesis protein [Oenococcus oeni]|uniref:Polysaccharide biosynthesis protein n=1 Tax=Oenococcus oeni TaxID=1247 RepID=A0AAQ2UW46_OENOE|nr:hypothetical protein [Oenococcus oeni]SYW03994.1 Polysaccharide biosynthesis protein [Oenococcus oeni]VDB98854.1 Polysaccharide biosynthesis protein [Oenococcus oeni]
MIIEKLKKSAFFKDVILTFSTQVAVMLSGFLMNKILANKLGVSEFGIFNIAKRSGTVASFVILMGLGISIPRYISMSITKKDGKGQKYYSSGIFIILLNSIVLFLVSLIFSSFISKILFGSVAYEGLTVPMVIFAIGLTSTSFLYSAFRGANLYLSFSFSQVIGQFLIMISLVINRNVETIITLWGMISICFSILLIIFIQLRSKTNFAYKNLVLKTKSLNSEMKELLVYGFPRIIGEIVQFSYYLIPLIVINTRFNSIQTGLFSASTGILQMFLPFFSYLGLILLPYVSSSVVGHNFNKVSRRINQLVFVYLTVSVMAILFGYFFANFLLSLLYSREFISGAAIAKILLLTLVPRSIFLLLRNPIDAISKVPYNTFLLSISMIILLFSILVSPNVSTIAWSFVSSDVFLAVGSTFIWNILKKRVEAQSNEKD